MPSIAMTLLIVAGLLVMVSLLQPLANRLGVPHSVLLAGLGIALGGASAFSAHAIGMGPVGEVIGSLGLLDISAQAFLHIFLPILLFETALTIDVRRMMDDLAPILLMAIVAVVVCTGMVGLALWQASGMALAVCLLLGAIVATTDPVAVVGIFRDVGAPQRLSMLVEGESLLNDAAAIAMFTVLAGLIITGRELDLAEAGWLFAKAFAGGALVGYGMAQLMLLISRPLRNLPLAETSVTLALAYLSYIVAEHYIGVSGVVAVVIAALVVGSAGRVVISPRTWEGLVNTWSQIGFWASSLVFILASMLVPRFLEDVSLYDAGLLAAVVLAAFVARAVVLWGLMPALSAAGLGQRVDHAYKLVILWGGLRGAVTLALALAVTESAALGTSQAAQEIKRFVAVLATGFVLFTLLVNATTLRLVMRLLRLDELSPVEAALRSRTISLALAAVAERIRTLAKDHRIAPDIAERIGQSYRDRLAEVSKEAAGEVPLTRVEQINLGLIALTNREAGLYRAHFADQMLSRRIVGTLLAKTGRLRDGAKTGGPDAYLRAARDSLHFRVSFRAAAALHRWFGIERPLARLVADRFETLMISRMAIETLIAFNRGTLGVLMGPAIRHALSEILGQRLANCNRSLEALRLQYPEYEHLLQERFLRQAALRIEEAEYRALLAESAISREIFDDLDRSLRTAGQELTVRPHLDLGLKTEDLVGRFPMFAGLGEDRIREIASRLTPRLAYPGERLISIGERGDSMYFISSGAVEVEVGESVIRLGRGDFFGELALLTGRRRNASVTAISYCQLLALSGRDFRSFVKVNPDLRARIREIASRRLRGESWPTAEPAEPA